jgi:hypothetical protein
MTLVQEVFFVSLMITLLWDKIGTVSYGVVAHYRKWSANLSSYLMQTHRLQISCLPHLCHRLQNSCLPHLCVTASVAYPAEGTNQGSAIHKRLSLPITK